MLTAVVTNGNDVAGSAMHLKRGGRAARPLLKKPAINTQLAQDLGMVRLRDPSGYLGVPDQISPVFIKDEELEIANDLAIYATQQH